MAWFHFTGNNALGNPVQGRQKAANRFALVARLKSLGITVVTIKPINRLKVWWLLLKSSLYFLLPIRAAELSVFYYQLAGMLQMGMSVKNALLVIMSHVSNPRLTQILNDVLDKLTKGHRFAYALNQHRAVFSKIVINLIALAHARNELVAVLNYCDKALSRFMFIRKLIYIITPQLALTLLMLIVLIFARVNYLADFQYAIYVFGNPEPVTIKLFALVTSFFTVHVLSSVLVIVFGFVVLRCLIKYIGFIQYIYHIVLLSIPIIRGVLIAKERERLALIYSVLLSGGATVQKCAQYSSIVVENRWFRRRVKRMAQAVNQGDAFSTVLRRFGIFASAEVQLIALGMISCSLPSTFERVYSVSQMILEKKFMLLTESTRLFMYLFNLALLLFTAVVLQQLFFYPGVRS